MAGPLWLNSGKLIVSAGKAVLCGNCPCGPSCCPGVFPDNICLKITDDGNCATGLMGANPVLTRFSPPPNDSWRYTGPMYNLGRTEFGDCRGGGSGSRFVPFNFFVTLSQCFPGGPNHGVQFLSFDILNKHPCDIFNLQDACTNFCLAQLNGILGGSIQVTDCPPVYKAHGSTTGGINLNGCFGCGGEFPTVWTIDLSDAAGGC